MCRKTNNIFYFLIVVVFLSCAKNRGSEYANVVTGKVVYGVDSRRDLHEVTNTTYLKLAKSTAIQVYDYSYTFRDNYYLFNENTIGGVTLGEQMQLCPNERFYEQLAPGSCSGFLVGKDIIVTAGHCIETQDDCDNAKWFFDFSTNLDGSVKTRLHESKAYSCEKIIGQKLTSGDDVIDYAVIKLDREVNDRKPLKVRTDGKIDDNQKVAIIGYPSGLPVKIADDANVMENTIQSSFKTNLDSFAGNSGSPVFNTDTWEVEGILVRGSRDYKVDFENQCMYAIHLPHDGNGKPKEAVTRITIVSEIMNYLRY